MIRNDIEYLQERIQKFIILVKFQQKYNSKKVLKYLKITKVVCPPEKSISEIGNELASMKLKNEGLLKEKEELQFILSCKLLISLSERK